MTTDNAMLTVPEAAAVCNISRSRMYHIVAAREIAVHRFGSSVRISPEDLRAWIAGKRDYSKNEIIQIAADRAARQGAGSRKTAANTK